MSLKEFCYSFASVLPFPLSVAIPVPSLHFCPLFPPSVVITNPLHPMPPPHKLLTPSLLYQYTNSSIHFSLFSGMCLPSLLCLAVSLTLSPTLILGKCRSFPDKFLTDWKRSKSSGDHQGSSAKKCVGIVWMGRG